MVKRIFNLSNLTLVTALALSAIAAWYSILGLTAIFAAAVLPIIIMGGSLEVAKVVTTVWLHKYWDRISWQMKAYLVPAVIALAFLTSMGIFGFLSKAHMDQGVPTSNIAAQVALIDEKIKTQRENIDLARKALAQMDAQVDQRLSRGDSEAGAERAVAIRKQQAKERASLQTDIATAQKEITKLNEERAPIASDLRKIEAEVGPIKYIAALIYGDNPDQNVLERAVRWVIILIVFVFDPLALTLVIASNTSRKWETYEEPKVEEIVKEEPTKESEPITESVEAKEEPTEVIVDKVVTEESPEESLLDKHPYLFVPPGNPHPPGIEPCPPMVAISEEVINEPEEVQPVAEEVAATVEPTVTDEITVDSTAPVVTASEEIETDGVTKEKPYKEMEDGYVSYEGKMIKKAALKEIKPEFFMLQADDVNQSNSGFGTQFPKYANKGDSFVRVDVLPNKVYKFNGQRWIEIMKNTSDTYLHNKEYLQHLVSKISSGEYDVDLLSDLEKEQIEQYLRTHNT